MRAQLEISNASLTNKNAVGIIEAERRALAENRKRWTPVGLHSSAAHTASDEQVRLAIIIEIEDSHARRARRCICERNKVGSQLAGPPIEYAHSPRCPCHLRRDYVRKSVTVHAAGRDKHTARRTRR